MMNRQRGITGLIVILGLILGFGIWQQRSQAAGPNRQGVQQVASSATGNGLASPALRSATAAPMATITVQSLFFDGPANAANCPGVNCRLRDAIAAAVAGDTIDFSVTGTINLLFGELVIDKNLTINGPGAAQLVISGFNSSRIFRILPGVTVALSGMTVTQGNHNDIGGGIYNSGTLTIVDSIFTYNFSGGRGGGGIFNDGILTVTNNSFSLNRPAPQSSGGAISNFGTATVINSTFFDNLSGPAGGGINNNGTLTIINSTFSRNGASVGGAIYHIGDRILTIINSTISDNSAPQGGGIAGSVISRNSIIAGNFANRGPDVIGTLTSLGNNIIGNNRNLTITPATGDLIGTDANPINPLLAPIGNYGGATQTHALLPGSPAINAGNNCVLTNTCASGNLGFNLTTDQRGAGFNRQVGSAVDIGAFESRGFTLAIAGGNNQSAAAGSAFALPLSVSVSSANSEPVNGGQVTFTPPASGATASIAGNPATIASGTATSGTLISNTTIGGPYTVAASAAGATAVNFSLINANSAPMFTPAAAISLEQGHISSDRFIIGTVSDAQTAAGSLTVREIAGGTATGIVPYGITNAGGTISMLVFVECTATSGTIRFQVSDGNLTSTGDLPVTVTAHVVPTLTYENVSVPLGASTTNPPTSTGNSSFNGYSVQSKGTYTGTISFDAFGVVSISEAAPVGTHTITIRATDICGATRDASFTLTVVAGTVGGLQFYPLAHPVRLLDTRAGQPGCDAPGAMIAGQTSRTQTAAGRTCDGLTIPANAKALTGNITTVQSGGGYLTLYPSDSSQPTVANSNYTPNQILNNVFTVGLGADDGAFKIFVTSNTNVVIDVTGYYAPPGTGGLYFHPLPKPIRLLESRVGQPGCQTINSSLQAGSVRTQLGITTCDGVTIPAGAQALVGNATTVGPQTGGWLTFYPADAAQPFVASSNFLTNDIMNAPFTVGLSPSGDFNVFTTSTTDLVIDVLGYYSTQLNDLNGQGLLFKSLPTPVRLLDTRVGFAGCFTPGAPMIAGTTYTQLSTGACLTIPATAKAVVGNATVVNANSGYLTFWPSSAAQPFVASSNFLTGQIFNRHFTLGLGPDGAFKLFSSGTTDLVIDLSGYFAP